MAFLLSVGEKKTWFSGVLLETVSASGRIILIDLIFVFQVIKAGEKLRHSKKKAKMASKQRECGRDWGRVSL